MTRENYSVEEGLQMVFDEDEAHGGMSSDEESELDMELASWSDFSSDGEEEIEEQGIEEDEEEEEAGSASDVSVTSVPHGSVSAPADAVSPAAVVPPALAVPTAVRTAPLGQSTFL